MSRVVNAWVQLNRDARKVCRSVLDALLTQEGNDATRHVCGAFMTKATETLSAVNVLYAHNLAEPAQALIRILFELRINFDCFRHMAAQDPHDAFSRLRDSMMLEKIKQARASGFMGIPTEIIRNRPTLPSTQSQFSGLFSSALPYRRISHGITG